MLGGVFSEVGVFCPDPFRAWTFPIFPFLSASWYAVLEAAQSVPGHVMTRSVQLGVLFLEIQLISAMCA